MEKQKLNKKSKVPVVRMTKTARMRLLNSNPIIKCEAIKTNNKDLIQNLDLDTVSHVKKCILDKSEILVCENKKTISETGKNKLLSVQAPKSKAPMKRNIQIKKARRSLSAPGANDTKNDIPTLEDPLNTSVSLESIPKSIENEGKQIIKTSSENRKSLAHQRKMWSTPSAPIDLKRRLSEWLVKKSKSYSSFKHLKCFGVRQISVINENNKENVNTSNLNEHSSYEDLKIDCPNSNPREEEPLVFAPSDLERVAKEALSDLQSLISEGYPKDQCDAWLSIIRQKCPEVAKTPQYWECRAVLDHYKGDIGSAIESYRTAVVQGAEVSTIEQSLDHLLEKFKVLEIDSSCSSRQTEKMSQDLKNIVRSMVIKFAIQEKSFKGRSHSEQSNSISSTSAKILVTPVRRSTRLNRSGFTVTPGVTLCSSLQEIEPEVREKMTFQSNLAL